MNPTAARSLIEPSLHAGESLVEVAIGRHAVPVALTLALVFGLPCAVIAIAVILHGNGVAPALVGAITGAAVLAMIAGVWLARRRGRLCVVGLTSQRLIVARFTGDPPAITRSRAYALDKLRGVSVTDRMINTGANGIVAYTTARLELADPQHPQKLDFTATMMEGNMERSKTIRESIVAAARAA